MKAADSHANKSKKEIAFVAGPSSTDHSKPPSQLWFPDEAAMPHAALNQNSQRKALDVHPLLL